METFFGKISIRDNSEIIENARLIIDEKKYEIEFSTSISDFHNIKLINGIFNGIGEVTIINSKNVSSESGAGAEIRKYIIQYILKGILLNDINDCYFDSAFIRMSGLLDWTEINSIDYSRKKDHRILKIKDLEKIPFYKSNQLEINIYSSNTISFNRNPNKRTITEHAGFEIINKSSVKMDLSKYLKIFKELQKIVLILGNKKTDISFTSLHNKDTNPIQLLWKDSGAIGKPTTFSSKIRFIDINKNLPQILKNWFEIKDLHTSLELILEKSINISLSRENHFLNNCFALETFHRRFKNYKLYPKKTFRDIKANILNSIDDPTLCKLIENNLAHINEPNFRSRLNDFEKDFNAILPNSWDTKDYLRKIVKTRNYLVHRGSSKSIFDNFDMLYAAFFLETITKINVYRILGIEQDIIERLLEENGSRIQGFYSYNKDRKFRI